MKKNELEDLLKRHCQLSPLESCGQHWVPENKSLDWYLGFLQSIEIHKGIRELFAKEEKQKAYEILGSRVRSELTKFVPKKDSLSNAVEGFIEFLLSLLIARLGLPLICEKLANLCDKANQKEMAYLFGLDMLIKDLEKLSDFAIVEDSELPDYFIWKYRCDESERKFVTRWECLSHFILRHLQDLDELTGIDEED